MRIALFNVCYSANLGDGLLSACLVDQIKAECSCADVFNVDLAGRTGYGAGGGRRQVAVHLLSRAPNAVRRTITSSLVRVEVGRTLRRHWRRALATADVAVLGGGNLLSDTDLNFPLKIAALAREIGAAKLPWCIYGVGVSDNWSASGKTLVEQALLAHPPRSVAVRDERSKTIWDRVFATSSIPAATLCVDPALLTAELFPATRVGREAPILGFNVMAQDELVLHADRTPLPVSVLTDWWIEVVQRALSSGFSLRLFTNGSPLDEAYLSSIRKLLPRTLNQTNIMVAARPDTPASLASIISKCDVIAGHRMHAHIAAYSYRIPSVGFRWDVKLDSFFLSVGRKEYLIDAGRTSPDEAVDVFLRAYKMGIDRASWNDSIASARRYVRSLAADLECI